MQLGGRPAVASTQRAACGAVQVISHRRSFELVLQDVVPVLTLLAPLLLVLLLALLLVLVLTLLLVLVLLLVLLLLSGLFTLLVLDELGCSGATAAPQATQSSSKPLTVNRLPMPAIETATRENVDSIVRSLLLMIVDYSATKSERK